MNPLNETTCEEQRLRPSFDRRSFLRSTLAGTLGFCLSENLFRVFPAAANPKATPKNCILLWMDGGPSQMDTFNPKPGTANGGPFKALDTPIPGVQLGEHLPRLAEQMRHLTLVRSMTTKEGSHQRARYLGHTGFAPNPTLIHPSLGAMVSAEIGDREANLPQFVSIASPSFGAGYLGAENAPFIVDNPNEKVENVSLPEDVDRDRFSQRLGLLDRMEKRFAGKHHQDATLKHHSNYNQAVRFMFAPEQSAFDLGRESQALRERYGMNNFGQGCLLARRLLETGVRFVEVTLKGWDTHEDNFTRVEELCGQVDPGFSTLVEDLRERGLWDSTLVVWMGEFGRKPVINAREGRDHFTRGFSAVLGGCGLPEGYVLGSTSPDGEEIVDRPVSTADLFHTLLTTLGINPLAEYRTPSKRPITLADDTAAAIPELLRV
jgi:hypothetical protein